MTQPAQIRVFTSSTFHDVIGERDLLVQEVSSELRRKRAKEKRWEVGHKARPDAVGSIRPVRGERAKHQASAASRRPTFCGSVSYDAT